MNIQEAAVVFCSLFCIFTPVMLSAFCSTDILLLLCVSFRLFVASCLNTAPVKTLPTHVRIVWIVKKSQLSFEISLNQVVKMSSSVLWTFTVMVGLNLSLLFSSTSLCLQPVIESAAPAKALERVTDTLPVLHEQKSVRHSHRHTQTHTLITVV